MEKGDQSISGCLPRIRSIFNILTKAEKKAAEYILANPAEVVHGSITELAEASGSAEATIFRLCQKTGFRGFQHFKIALVGDLYSPRESVSREVDPEDSLGTIADKIFREICDGLADTLKILSPEALEAAVQAILAARRIDVYGSGGSAVIGADMEHRFMRFGMMVRAYADPHLQIGSAALLSPEDLVIAISHTGANRDLLDSVGVAKESGAKVLLITSYMKSPLSHLADIILVAAARETQYRSEAMSSRLAHLAIADVLYTAVLLRKEDQALDNMQKIRKAIAIKRV